jgi:hypothetical protein
MHNLCGTCNADGQAFSCIAHIWRIVMRYADSFYAHIAFFEPQFIQCMYRMISVRTSICHICAMCVYMA